VGVHDFTPTYASPIKGEERRGERGLNLTRMGIAHQPILMGDAHPTEKCHCEECSLRSAVPLINNPPTPLWTTPFIPPQPPAPFIKGD
jgi:hypothetical protein